MVNTSEAPGWRRESGAGHLALRIPSSRSRHGARSDIYRRRPGAGCGETCVNGARGDLPVGVASAPVMRSTSVRAEDMVGIFMRGGKIFVLGYRAVMYSHEP
ncbi:MAG: hypothetical protein ACXQT2_05245 [Methanotrichaceae archaeon]